jgi:modulator of FtsH protease HflK
LPDDAGKIAHVALFFVHFLPIQASMDKIGGFWERIGLAMTGGRNPWGGSPGGGPKSDGGGSGGDSGGADDGGAGGGEKPRGPRNPWLPGSGAGEDGPRRSASIEDIFRNRGPEGPRRRPGGPRGPNFTLPGLPGGASWLPVIIAGSILLFVGISSVHQLGPKEQGVVTTFGKYSRTIEPGLSLTFPWPVQEVVKEQVSEFRIEQIPEGEAQKLMLTGDQNLVDLSYVVRWSIKDLKDYLFQLDSPRETVREVAEAAMRAAVSGQELDTVLSGAGRADIEGEVRGRMQQILDAYRAGVTIQGVEIRKTDPPAEVEEAFKDVSAAQQEAESYQNQAEAFAQQVLARAQGDAAAFDKVYEEYRLAPEVTRRRMYYETMERVLSKTDKTVVETGGVTPYLPLPEVQRRSRVVPAAPPVAVPEGN